MPAEKFVDIGTDPTSAFQQAAFYKCKTSLHPREFLVTVDFVENYTFIFQDAAKGFHWKQQFTPLLPTLLTYAT